MKINSTRILRTRAKRDYMGTTYDTFHFENGLIYTRRQAKTTN